MTLSDRIKQLRKNNQIKQADLAKQIGVPQSTLSKYENGNLRIDADTLAKIATALGVSINNLLGIDEDSSLGTKMAHYRNHNISPQHFEIETNLEKISISNILNDLKLLNSIGRNEAVKRVNELTKLEEYTK